MNRAPLRIGVIGCGALAQAVHIPLLQRMKGAELTGIADNHPDVLRHAGRNLPPSRQFSDGLSLIKSETVDAVVIATPASSHSWYAVAAFEHGLSVYLEKPIATDIPDGSSILDTWKRSGRSGMAGFNYRFNPLYMRLRDAAASHDIVSTEAVFRIPRTAEMGWRAERSAGGGALLDLASHEIDLTRFITRDEITEVTGIIRSMRSEQDSAVLECTTRRGIQCRITAEYDDAFEHTFKLVTRETTLSVDLAHSHTVDEAAASNRFPSPARLLHIYRKFRSPSFEPSYERALRSFIDGVKSGAPMSPDLNDGFVTLQVTSAAEESASSGRPVAVAFE